MTATVVTLLGALAGGGILLVVVGLLGTRPSLEAELARLDPYSARGDRSVGAAGSARPAGGAGGLAVGLIDRLGGGRDRVAADLAVVGGDRGRYGAAIATAAVAGGAALPALGATAALAGIRTGFAAPLLGCLPLAVAASLVPVVTLRRRARAARAQFGQALASWLELVALAQAAGMGLESALHAVSELCDDPSFRRIRHAVDVARATGTPPWGALLKLGEELGIGDLEELGASLELAGAEGARIRGSLAAKAASLRRRELAGAEAAANATTERLFVPSVLLMCGFVLFVGYPALVTVTHVL